MLWQLSSHDIGKIRTWLDYQMQEQDKNVIFNYALIIFVWNGSMVNILRSRQNGHHFSDIFKCILFDENVWISHKISLKFVPDVRINNIPALVQIMAWHRPGNKLLSKPMMLSLLTHICVTPPQWLKLILHMPQQLGSRDMWKIMTCMDYQIKN